MLSHISNHIKSLHNIIALKAAALVRAYRSFRRRRRVSSEVERLARLDDYYFTADLLGTKCARWRDHLADFAGRADVRALEIGSHEGRSAVWMLEHILTHASSHITCVDPFHPMSRVRFDHNLRVAGAGERLRVIQERSEVALLRELEGERFDIIYVDGSHTAPNVLFDILFSWQKLKRGGVMILDDYRWRPDLPQGLRPQPSVDYFRKQHDDEFDLLEETRQVVVRKR